MSQAIRTGPLFLTTTLAAVTVTALLGLGAAGQSVETHDIEATITADLE